MTPDHLQPIFQLGAVGAVLAWFMFKAEPRLRGIEEAIDRHSRANMLFLLKINNLTQGEKLQIEQLLQEMDEADKSRKK